MVVSGTHSYTNTIKYACNHISQVLVNIAIFNINLQRDGGTPPKMYPQISQTERIIQVHYPPVIKHIIDRFSQQNHPFIRDFPASLDVWQPFGCVQSWPVQLIASSCQHEHQRSAHHLQYRSRRKTPWNKHTWFSLKIRHPKFQWSIMVNHNFSRFLSAIHLRYPLFSVTQTYDISHCIRFYTI